MLISEFDYELPAELIAQEPLARREFSRMLFVNRHNGTWQDKHFFDLPKFINAGDIVVLNNTKVFPARLVGVKENSEGRVELFLIRQIADKIWETLARPARRLKNNSTIAFGGGELIAQVLQKQTDGRVIVRFAANGNFHDALEKIGQTPLPPYIRRTEQPTEIDRERYQTVFAKMRGSIAAPTAGLHFTPEVLKKLRERGAEIVEITLHVGYGTFEPVRVRDVSEHKVAPEQTEISAEAATAINRAKAENRRIVAVGTTTTRSLESATDEHGKIQAGRREANLTILPGYQFKTVNALLTNFHLPQSSLLVLVSTFAGRDFILSAYQHAVTAKYRFYSYGDCMLIV
jgi:S-adenosylmethionine:tRNA ribosyltransferase-isomerase